MFIRYFGLFFGKSGVVNLSIWFMIFFGLLIDNLFIVYFGKLREIKFFVFCVCRFLYFLFCIILNSFCLF